MNCGKTFLVCMSVLAFGCAGGGVQNNPTGGDQYASDAEIQMLPYETLRNNLTQALCLNSNSEALQILDDNRAQFGANEGGKRYLKASLTRLRKHVDICDAACREGMENCPKDLFDNTSDKFDPTTIGRRIMGKPLSDARTASIAASVALEGYDSDIAKQHAICVSCCASLEAQLQ